MRVHLVNPSHVSFGVAVITPRWLYVLAARDARRVRRSDPRATRRSSRSTPRPSTPGDVVGIGIHTGNALRGYEVGRVARERGAHVVFGGIHATLYPEEAHELGGAHAVVKGDGDVVWPQVLRRLRRRHARSASTRRPRAGRATSSPARWDLLPRGPLHVGLGADRARLPEALLVLLGLAHRRPGAAAARASDAVVDGDRRAAAPGLPLHRARRRQLLSRDAERPRAWPSGARTRRGCTSSRPMRDERFELMDRLAQLPERHGVLHADHDGGGRGPGVPDAMRRAHIEGALVGVESVTPEGLKDVYKDFNLAGDALVERLRTFREHGVHVLGSFIFGLPSDRPETFDATAALAERAGITFAQFVMLTPFPGTVDFERWERDEARARARRVARHPAHAPLADPAGEPAEGLHAAPGDVAPTRSAQRTQARLGPLLPLRSHLGAVAVS